MNTDNGDGLVGTVFQKNLGQYSVHSDGREIVCTLSSRLHKQLIYPTAAPSSLRRIVQSVREIDQADPVAIGDTVRFVDAGENRGVITEVLPRRNKLSRPATTPGQRVFEQVIVANADQVMPVFSVARPTPKWGLLDRCLVAAEAAGLPVLICITKTDLPGHKGEVEATLAEYRRIGYKVQLVSAATGDGLEEIKQSLQDRVSVLIGKSGVGKTSLLNAIQPGLGLRVNAVSQGKDGKGSHTTTEPGMFQLDCGGAIVGTPGVREFGLWDVDEEDVALFFPEMRPLVGTCKFRLDCRHDEEPGCAIRKAVMRGEISPYRYQSYLKLRATS
jgi:ribosome biogenesis GTPase / thiamine phosphate phosphatase